MKLHKIKATNVNSLYGEQTLDLDVDLNGAPLFLIQGPTGAGKSTLMDTISLALFGTTPRMGDTATGTAVAESLMSRGAYEIAAEVEFSKWEAATRVRYRATWSTARAFKRPDGTLKTPHRSLERWLPAEGRWAILASDHREKVFREKFNEVLGDFTAVDFQRSMLLAQGRFDQLLHASPEERAGILEKLTRSDDYKGFGLRAAEMNRVWKGIFERLNTKKALLGEVSAEQVAEDEAAAAALGADRAGLEAQRERAERALAYLQRETALKAAEQAIDAAVAQTAAEAAAAAPELARLAEHERCAEAFAANDEADKRGAEAEAIAQGLTAAQQALPALQASAAAAQTAEAVALERREGTAAALAGLRAPVAAAIEAQQAWSRADGARLKAAEDRDTEAKKLEVARGSYAKQALVVEQNTVKHANATAVLEGLSADAGLEAGVAPLRARVEALGRSQAAIQVEAARLSAQAAKLTTTEGRLAADEGALKAQEAALAPLRGHREIALTERSAAADAVCALLPAPCASQEPAAVAEAAGEARSRLLRLHGEQKQAIGAIKAAFAAAAAAAERAKALDVATTALGAAHARVAGATEALSAAEQAVALGQAALAPLRRVAELSAQRVALQPDEACPLCGSAAHPYIDDPSQLVQNNALHDELTRLDAELRADQAAVEAARAAQSKAQALEAAAEAQQASAAAEQRTAAAAAAEAEAEAARARIAAELPAGADEAAAAEALNATVADGKALAAAIKRLEDARNALSEAERAVQSGEAALVGATAKLAEATAGLQRDLVVLKTEQQANTDAERAAEGVAAELRAAFVALGGAELAPAEALAAAALRVTAYQVADQAQANAARDLAAAQQVLAERQEALTAAEGSLEAVTQKLAEAAATADQAAAENSATQTILIDLWAEAVAAGVAPSNAATALPADRLRALEGEQKARDQAHTAATQGCTAANQAVAKAETAVQERQGALDRATTARAAAEAALQAQLIALALPGVEALAARRLAPDALPALRALGRRLEAARLQAEADRAAAERQRAAHLAGRPSELSDDIDEEAVLTQISHVRAALASIDEALLLVRGRLQRASEVAAGIAALKATEARLQIEARPWQALHELIGKGEGKHFQQFAQALNLSQLLYRANHHLSGLNPRYRLQQELDQGLPTLHFVVVDRWMSTAPRALKTLSGGESFLVSLALALGLSDLRSGTMPIETLLLDEGFGTLDPDTLEVALAALQQLHQGGRQVGIISHVGALAERIPAQVHVEPIGEGRSRVRVPKRA